MRRSLSFAVGIPAPRSPARPGSPARPRPRGNTDPARVPGLSHARHPAGQVEHSTATRPGPHPNISRPAKTVRSALTATRHQSVSTTTPAIVRTASSSGHTGSWRRNGHDEGTGTVSITLEGAHGTCADSCTGCPASTGWAPRPAPRCWPPGRSRPPPRQWALDLAISMIDLTTLEGAGHAGQGARAVREGQAARPGRPDRAAGRRGLRLPRPGARRRAGGRGSRRHVAERRDRLPERPGQPGRQARRHPATPSPRAPTRSTW